MRKRERERVTERQRERDRDRKREKRKEPETDRDPTDDRRVSASESVSLRAALVPFVPDQLCVCVNLGAPAPIVRHTHTLNTHLR